jgi:hypothetical protein
MVGQQLVPAAREMAAGIGHDNQVDPAVIEHLLAAGMLAAASQSKGGMAGVWCLPVERLPLVFVAMQAEAARLRDVPCYDQGKRMLWWHDVVVRSWGRLAQRQEVVLLAFQKVWWAETIENPFPLEPGVDRHELLCQTRKDLNRGLREGTIRFFTLGKEQMGWMIAKE